MGQWYTIQETLWAKGIWFLKWKGMLQISHQSLP